MLDEQMLVKSDAPAQAQAFLQSAGRIDSLKFLIENGYKKIVAGKSRITIEKQGYDDADLGPARLGEILDSLNSFVS